MPVVKVSDMAFVRMNAPDLGKAEQFLLDFGMSTVEKTPKALYMRGTDPDPFIEAVHLGEARVLSSAWYVDHVDDLKRVSQVPGATGIENLDEPGGGKRVQLTDPLGYKVEFICDRTSAQAMPTEPAQMNLAWEPLVRKTLQRFDRRPSRVKRIAHFVVSTPEVKKTLAWYREMLGLVRSEDIYEDDPENLIGSFNRVDQGEDYVDHHVFFCRYAPNQGMNHVSFEVQDIDDVMLGHDHLKSQGYRPMWGVGRHFLGSQVFDYWCDPWGRVHEHWTDSDRLNIHGGEGLLSKKQAFKSQWGPAGPKEFHDWATP
jgi:catechol 2,3-dioxygenase-like lactoylglutathione lyase family enzyme